MSQIVNNDKLTLILTQYGLERVADAIADPSLNLNLTKIKFGNGKNNEYYTPSEAQVSLEGDTVAEFYIYKKELLEDGLTISFYTIIPENIGGFDIREVGLYETVNGKDELFAIGTCQPFVKPTTSDNYFIAVDYYIFLRAANFASVYDQITLDSEHSLVTEPDMEDLMRTFLFTDANLINQINTNSRIIGYNRATQLYERMEENKSAFSHITLYKNYATFIETSSSQSIFSFWAFDYSENTQTQNSIPDLSVNNYNLSTTVPITSLKRVYRGFMSMFSMENANFLLDSSVPVQLFDGATGNDIPFVMAFTVNPLNLDVDRTLLAKSNYSASSHTFEIKELRNRSLYIRLFTDASNYITFTSAEGSLPAGVHSLILSYDPTKRDFIVYTNYKRIQLTSTETGTYTHMKELPGTLYTFEGEPVYIGYANSSSSPTIIYNEDGSPYSEIEWTINNNALYYENNLAQYSEEDDLLTDQLYAWLYDDGENVHYVYTKVPPATEYTLSEPWATLYNNDYTPYIGDDFEVTEDIIQFRGEQTVYAPSQNPQRLHLFAWKYTAPKAFIYGNKSSDPSALYEYTEEKNLYTGSDWTVTDGRVFYLGQEAHLIGSPVLTSYPALTSYITNEQGQISDPISSEVGIISIIKDRLEEEQVRALSLLLCATAGMNPYISG